MIVAFVLGFVTIFKPKLARITAPLYALGYGFAIGAISHMYNLQWDGIVLQAVGATLAVFGVMLFLYATRIIKVTKKYVMIVVSADGRHLRAVPRRRGSPRSSAPTSRSGTTPRRSASASAW